MRRHQNKWVRRTPPYQSRQPETYTVCVIVQVILSVAAAAAVTPVTVTVIDGRRLKSNSKVTSGAILSIIDVASTAGQAPWPRGASSCTVL